MYGVAALSDSELLQAVGIKTPVVLSGATTENFSPRERTIFNACLELSRRHYIRFEKRKVSSSQDSYTILLPFMDGSKVEKFYCLYLSRSNVVLGVREISVGGTSATVADAKVIFKYALELGASALILSHNHPSGALKPSQPDIELTKKIGAGAKSLDMVLLDHIIVAEKNNYFSFADSGLL